MSLLVPVTVLFVKLEPMILPSWPFQNTAPAALFAVLLLNVEFSILPLDAPACQSIAPPLDPASLFSNKQFENVLLVQSARPSTPRKNTAPPWSSA